MSEPSELTVGRAGGGGGREQPYHKACFKCVACSKRLDASILLEHDDQVSERHSGWEAARCMPSVG